MGKIALTLGILIPVLVIGTPVALAYGFCYDGSKPDVTYSENFKSDEVANNIIFESLETTKDDKLIRFGISEQNINDLFHLAMEGLNETANNYIDAPYVKIDEAKQSVDFYLHAHVPMFATKLAISTNFTYIEANGTNEAGFLFTINNVKLARLNALDLGLTVAGWFINDQLVESLLQQAGVNMKVSLKDKTLFYSTENLMNDVVRKSGIDNIYLSMCDFVLENNLLDVSCTKEKVGVNFNLERLTKNADYVDASKSLNLTNNMLGYIDDIETLLKDSIITIADIDNTISYLANGYDKVSGQIQTFIKNKNLSIIGINDVTTHKGFNIPIGENITQIFNKQIENIDPLDVATKQKLDIVFDENDLNGTLKTSQIIGKSYNFTACIGGVNKLNSIFIDDFYVNIMNNELDFVVGVNFNGLSTKLIIRSAVKEYEGKQIKLEISHIYFGEIQANEEIKKACVDFVMDALTNLTDWFKADGTNRLIFFDLTTCVNQLSDSTLKTFLKDARLSSTVRGTKLSDNGQLNIAFSK